MIFHQELENTVQVCARLNLIHVDLLIPANLPPQSAPLKLCKPISPLDFSLPTAFTFSSTSIVRYLVHLSVKRFSAWSRCSARATRSMSSIKTSVSGDQTPTFIVELLLTSTCNGICASASSWAYSFSPTSIKPGLLSFVWWPYDTTRFWSFVRTKIFQEFHTQIFSIFLGGTYPLGHWVGVCNIFEQIKYTLSGTLWLLPYW